MTDRRPVGEELIAIAGLVAFQAAVVAGFARVFEGWGFVRPMLAIVVVGHLVAFALRRAGAPVWIAVPTLAVVLAWLVVAIDEPGTLRWLLPTSDTWEVLSNELSLARQQFPTAVAPVNFGAGWAPLAMTAIAGVVLLADTFAFRADGRAESLAPGTILFVFLAAVGDVRWRWTSSVLLVLTGVLAAVTLRWFHDRRRHATVRADRRLLPLTAPFAVALAGIVAAAAGVIGPKLPGVDNPPMVETRGRSAPGVTEVVSPLVDIRSRMTSRSEREMFQVRSDSPSYWRLTTLPVFDGRTFRLPSSPIARMPEPDGDAVGGAELEQEIRITGLRDHLVPAAADPTQAVGSNGDEEIAVRFNDDTATLVVSKRALEFGDTFTVVSELPDVDAESLRAAGSGPPPDPMFLELPASLPASVHALAVEVAGDAPTRYDAAIRLQEWFRTEFEYSLTVQSGHGSSAIESFLEDRVGYCEQFSATYATMARSLGIPSRVGVGFTQGELRDDGAYHVLGTHAHAWPELWFPGVGWVAFEPTPGRGSPTGAGYTGVEPAQAEVSPATTDGDTEVTPPVSAPTPATVVDDMLRPEPVRPAAPPGAATSPAGGNGARNLLMVVLVLAIIAAAPAAVRRFRRMSVHRHDAADHIEQAWATARRELAGAGVRGAPATTPTELADLTAARLPVAARPVSALGDAVDLLLFAPDTPQRSDRLEAFGAQADGWIEQIRAVTTSSMTRWERVRRYFTSWD